MDLSNPFGTMADRKMNASELASAIRQDIAAELDAVALYQAHIDATDDERARKVLAHVRDDEKDGTTKRSMLGNLWHSWRCSIPNKRSTSRREVQG